MVLRHRSNFSLKSSDICTCIPGVSGSNLGRVMASWFRFWQCIYFHRAKFGSVLYNMVLKTWSIQALNLNFWLVLVSLIANSQLSWNHFVFVLCLNVLIKHETFRAVLQRTELFANVLSFAPLFDSRRNVTAGVSGNSSLYVCQEYKMYYNNPREIGSQRKQFSYVPAESILIRCMFAISGVIPLDYRLTARQLRSSVYAGMESVPLCVF